MKNVNEAKSLPWPELLNRLIQVVGRKLTAYISGLKDVHSLDAWLAGEEPSGDITDRIRLSYEIVCTLLKTGDSARVVQAWLMGINPQLGDQVPLRLLREGELDTIGPMVLDAARSFAAGG